MCICVGLLWTRQTELWRTAFFNAFRNKNTFLNFSYLQNQSHRFRLSGRVVTTGTRTDSGRLCQCSLAGTSATLLASVSICPRVPVADNSRGWRRTVFGYRWESRKSRLWYRQRCIYRPRWRLVCLSVWEWLLRLGAGGFGCSFVVKEAQPLVIIGGR